MGDEVGRTYCSCNQRAEEQVRQGSLVSECSASSIQQTVVLISASAHGSNVGSPPLPHSSLSSCVAVELCCGPAVLTRSFTNAGAKGVGVDHGYDRYKAEALTSNCNLFDSEQLAGHGPHPESQKTWLLICFRAPKAAKVQPRPWKIQ